MGNSQPSLDLQNKEKKPDADEAPAAPRLYPDLQNGLPEQPQFGRPSMPGASPQPYARTQPLMRPSTSANTSAPRQVSGSHQQDKYSNLFVSAKRPQQRPELHKPHVVANPLQTLKDGGQPPKPASSRPSYDEDDFYGISKPANFPAWRPPAVVQPTFSSQQPPNPYFRPSMMDLTQNNPIMARPVNPSNHDMFRTERHETTDPFTYMNSSQASESIKALLEGAFEDEEDKPRTRRRKKELDKKIGDLADMVKDMSVNSEDKSELAKEEAEEEDDGTVPGLKVKLLPHQIDGVDWMVSKEIGKNRTYGGILADDMGLGKTIQSIALILSNPKPSGEAPEKSKRKLAEGVTKGTLVVAPLALIRQWEGELKDRIDEDHPLKICVHHGPQRTKSYKDLKKYDVVITTYQTLSSEHAGCSESLKVGCFGVHWYRIILDEAHSIKNRNAKASKAACALDAAYRWCLTGTPMQNGLDELQSLIHFLRIKPYCDLNEWRENITKPMNNGRGGLAVKRLRLILKSFMKRRTKDILKQEHSNDGAKGEATTKGKDPGFKIVARTVHNVEAEFTEQEQEFYNRLESRTDRSLEMMMAGNKMSYASALVLLMRLRQACNHPKLTGSDLSTETDASSGMETPSRRKASVEDDMDSIANMLGGLSVETKRCDMCQIELTSREIAKGAIRCAECQEDLDNQTDYVKEIKKTKKEKRQKQEQKTVKVQRRQARRVVEDSDDDEDGGEKNEDDDEDSSSIDGDEDEDEDYSSSDDSSSSQPTLLQSTKIRQLLSILREDSHTHKYIVFSFFTSMLDLIEPFLRSHRIRYVRYDGKMRNDAREASLNALRTDPSTRVLLCSLRAGSLGLNLTAASRVVILEPFWNPFVEEQAIDRVHRLNQTQDVKVFKITIKGTVEERILELQEKKRELARATIEGQGKKGAMRLNMQDMLKLFGREAESEHPVDVQEVGMGRGRTRGLLEGNRDTYSSSNPSQTNGGRGPAGGVSGSADDRREKPRVSDGKKKTWKEHEVYGRRW
ncbi:hypothetical protein AYL99_07356 [Fonsecaea erecta]|uniref:Uncharacterized protein n=1 Tax=Fonsecaea erecta TaxID=1367422 RepID=A0A178ZFL0_9EURO|nr:hypothetical protein AYL99_07356 [Fonsecaea erecta]OAP58266.1 hypothetical protein AYL99_07356 [Fonsecaea erecta]